MPRQGYSLYDSYQLSNSSAIPRYLGSTAPEALQVGAYLQPIYDAASSNADQIASAAQGVAAHAKDKALKDELYNTTTSKIDDWGKQGDWEHRYRAVQDLGRNFAQRALELQAPLQQQAEYYKSLENKDLDLTPFQKDSLKAISEAGYTGLKKDNLGRYVGRYSGAEPAKNINIPERVDKYMKDFAAQEGGTDYERLPNGSVWIVRDGRRVKEVSKDRVLSALNSARATDSEFQAYNGMMGDIAGFHGARYNDPSLLADKDRSGNPNTFKQNAMKLSQQQGIPFGQALGLLTKNAAQQSIASEMDNYAVQKYVHKDIDTKHLISADPFFLKTYHTQENLIGDIVTGNGVSPEFKSSSDVSSALTNTASTLEQNQNFVNQEKQNIARSLGKPVSSVSDDDVSKYYATNGSTSGLSRFQQATSVVQSSQQQLASLNRLKDEAKELAYKKLHPSSGGFNEAKTKATADFAQAITSGKIDLTKLESDDKMMVPGAFGKTNTHTGATHVITKANVNNFEVVDADNPVIGKKTITVRDKTTGKEHELSYTGDSAPFEAIAPGMRKMNWKDSYDQNVSGMRSNSRTIIFSGLDNNKQTDEEGNVTKEGALNTRVKNIVQGAGAIQLTDADGNKLPQKDADNIQALRAAGKFIFRGIEQGDNGKMVALLSVPVDPSATKATDKYKEVRVGLESNVGDRIADALKQNGKTFNDPSLYVAGSTLHSSSIYPSLKNNGTVRAIGKDGSGIEVAPGFANGTTIYQVWNIDKSGKRLGKNNQFPEGAPDIGNLATYLDELRAEGYSLKK